LFIDLSALLAARGKQKVVGHVHEQSQISRGVFTKGAHERGSHEL
jgi:hypothetical protein